MARDLRQHYQRAVVAAAQPIQLITLKQRARVPRVDRRDGAGIDRAAGSQLAEILATEVVFDQCVGDYEIGPAPQLCDQRCL